MLILTDIHGWVRNRVSVGVFLFPVGWRADFGEVWVLLGEVFGLVDCPCDALVGQIVGFEVWCVEWAQCDIKCIYFVDKQTSTRVLGAKQIKRIQEKKTDFQKWGVTVEHGICNESAGVDWVPNLALSNSRHGLTPTTPQIHRRPRLARKLPQIQRLDEPPMVLVEIREAVVHKHGVLHRHRDIKLDCAPHRRPGRVDGCSNCWDGLELGWVPVTG